MVKNLTIIANGLMVGIALDAAVALEAKGITARVLDLHTVSPIDEEAIVKSVRKQVAS